MVISVCNEKGGSGKTTIALNLAVKLGLLKEDTLLIDADPQRSIEVFTNIRANENIELIFNTVSKFGSSLGKEVKSLQKNGSVISLSKGVKGGTEKVIDLPSGLKKEELQKWLDAKYHIATKEGFEGTLDGWCYPRTKAGDAVEIERPIYEDKHQDGKYFIEGVTIDVNGADGIKRQNRISYKLK